MINLSKFADRLSELLFDAKLNAPELAKILGCKSNTITRYLQGNNLPSVKNAIRMANYFNCSVDYLLGVTDTEDNGNIKVCPPFSERLSFLCEKFSITKYKLQKDTGLPESAICKWQRGQTSPDLVSIYKIAEKYNCSMDYILGRED